MCRAYRYSTVYLTSNYRLYHYISVLVLHRAPGATTAHGGPSAYLLLVSHMHTCTVAVAGKFVLRGSWANVMWAIRQMIR